MARYVIALCICNLTRSRDGGDGELGLLECFLSGVVLSNGLEKGLRKNASGAVCH